MIYELGAFSWLFIDPLLSCGIVRQHIAILWVGNDDILECANRSFAQVITLTVSDGASKCANFVCFKANCHVLDTVGKSKQCQYRLKLKLNMSSSLKQKITIAKKIDPSLFDWILCCYVKDLPHVITELKSRKPYDKRHKKRPVRNDRLIEITENIAASLTGTNPRKKIFATVSTTWRGTSIDLRIEPDPPIPPRVNGKGTKKHKSAYEKMRRTNPQLAKALKELNLVKD